MVIQLGIPGIAPDKIFEQKKRYGVGKLVRKKLQEYIRIKLGVDQRTFANMLQVSDASVTQWLYTDRAPSARVIFKLSSAPFRLSYKEALELFEVNDE